MGLPDQEITIRFDRDRAILHWRVGVGGVECMQGCSGCDWFELVSTSMFPALVHTEGADNGRSQKRRIDLLGQR